MPGRSLKGNAWAVMWVREGTEMLLGLQRVVKYSLSQGQQGLWLKIQRALAPELQLQQGWGTWQPGFLPGKRAVYTQRGVPQGGAEQLPLSLQSCHEGIYQGDRRGGCKTPQAEECTESSLALLAAHSRQGLDLLAWNERNEVTTHCQWVAPKCKMEVCSPWTKSHRERMKWRVCECVKNWDNWHNEAVWSITEGLKAQLWSISFIAGVSWGKDKWKLTDFKDIPTNITSLTLALGLSPRLFSVITGHVERHKKHERNDKQLLKSKQSLMTRHLSEQYAGQSFIFNSPYNQKPRATAMMCVHVCDWYTAVPNHGIQSLPIN